MWQSLVFPPQVLSPIHRKGKRPGNTDFECTLDPIKPTKYDEMAIESYRTFYKLRDQGIIPQGVRFQVSVPTPINATWSHVDYAYRERVEPLYMERLIQNLRRLQKAMPPHDLALQFDATMEFAHLEHERGRIQDPLFNPYLSSVKEGILERIFKFSPAIYQDVYPEFHLCYGDRQHQQFVQPEDAGLLVEVATGIAQRVGPRHALEWIHFPVPKDRSDTAYFQPLQSLDIGDTKVFLGLVHSHDEDGSKQRLKAAQAVYPYYFGVATECGMGRTPLEDVDSIFTTSRTSYGISA